jgi:hypothetical protein
MKCFECPYLAYAGEEDNMYFVRWCDQRKKKCSEVYPNDCPQVQRETLYAEAVDAYNERYNRYIEACYDWQDRLGTTPNISEVAECAEKFAGPEPRMEDF